MIIKNIFSNRNIVIFATLIFVAWILFFDRNNYLDSLILDRKIETLETEKAYYKRRITEDSTVIVGLKDSAFVDKFARENFLMQRSDEQIYIIDQQ